MPVDTAQHALDLYLQQEGCENFNTRIAGVTFQVMFENIKDVLKIGNGSGAHNFLHIVPQENIQGG